MFEFLEPDDFTMNCKLTKYYYAGTSNKTKKLQENAIKIGLKSLLFQ